VIQQQIWPLFVEAVFCLYFSFRLHNAAWRKVNMLFRQHEIAQVLLD
jgi:hypothetical protein